MIIIDTLLKNTSAILLIVIVLYFLYILLKNIFKNSKLLSLSFGKFKLFSKKNSEVNKANIYIEIHLRMEKEQKKDSRRKGQLIFAGLLERYKKYIDLKSKSIASSKIKRLYQEFSFFCEIIWNVYYRGGMYVIQLIEENGIAFKTETEFEIWKNEVTEHLKEHYFVDHINETYKGEITPNREIYDFLRTPEISRYMYDSVKNMFVSMREIALKYAPEFKAIGFKK